MKSSYKRIGDFIREVKTRNVELKATNLLGINIDKYFMPSVANIVGTDMTTYKIVKKNWFACNRMHVGRDYRLPVALSKSDEDFMVSPAYEVFKITNTNTLLPEYLMMWFSRKEFDRNAWFYTDADVRGGLPWKSFCEIELPVPSINKQKEIVAEYNTIVNRINLNNQLIQKLEETAQAIYKYWFVDNQEDHWETKRIGDLCTLITDGKHGDCEDEINSGYYFASVKDLSKGEIIYDNVRQITKKDFEETHRRTNLSEGDILLTNAGTIGRMAIVKDLPETKRTTFQKSVAILKPNTKIAKTYFLFSLLKSNSRSIIDLAGGSTQSNLLLGDLRNYKIKYPGFDSVCDFEKTVTPIFQMMGLKGLEIQKLESAKNILLSKLVTIEQ